MQEGQTEKEERHEAAAKDESYEKYDKENQSIRNNGRKSQLVVQ